MVFVKLINLSCWNIRRRNLWTYTLNGVHTKKVKFIHLRFESLGPDYNLGRLAILEIEEYRMDKNLFKDKNA